METDKESPPAAGEQTRQQLPDKGGVIGGSAGGDPRPQPGTFATYRKICRNPTIALARAIATAPIRTSQTTIESDDDVDEEQTEFVQAQVARLWPRFIHDVLFGIDHGFQAFEEVWQEEGGQWIIDRMKPLLPELTEAMIDKETGRQTGLKNQKVVLDMNQVFWWAHDAEGDNPYGRSRLENIRDTAWSDWCDTNGRKRKYVKRVVGAVPQVTYPDGESQDASGATRPNFQLAQELVKKLENADGVYVPAVLAAYAEPMARAGIDPSKLLAWNLSFAEAKAAHGGEILELLKHDESLMMRGYLVPERGALEATKAGSRADSDNAGDVALVIADLILMDVITAFNAQVIDRMLLYNFGPDAVGTVHIARAGLDPALTTFYRTLITAVLGVPGNLDVLVAAINFDALVDASGLPKAKETVDIAQVVAQRQTLGGVSPDTPVPLSMVAAMQDIYRRYQFGVEKK